MKQSRLLFAVVVSCVMLAGVAHARRIIWRPIDKPPVSLRLALALAEAELEKREGDYHCLGASLARTFSDGDWELRFSSKDGKSLWVNVASDRQIKMSEHGFEY